MFEYTTINVLTLLSIVCAVGMMLISVTRFVTHVVQTLAPHLSATLATVTSTLAELHQHMVAAAAKNEQAFQKVLLRLELLEKRKG